MSKIEIMKKSSQNASNHLYIVVDFIIHTLYKRRRVFLEIVIVSNTPHKSGL